MLKFQDLSDHHDEGEFVYFNNIPCVTVESMVDTEENAYGVVEIYTNKILIKGKDESRLVNFC